MDADTRWEHLRRQRIDRRTLLRTAGRTGVGAAALALVGCGSDDDDDSADAQQAEQRAEEEPGDEPIAAGGIFIDAVALDGAEGSITLVNTGETPANLDGWFICRRPRYWPLPAVSIGPGERLVVNAGAGEAGDGVLFASGGIGSLGDNGEVALYVQRAFTNADSMIAYVGWGTGGGRKSVAQSAGLWEDDLDASQGQVITRTGQGVGAAAYSVE